MNFDVRLIQKKTRFLDRRLGTIKTDTWMSTVTIFFFDRYRSYDKRLRISITTSNEIILSICVSYVCTIKNSRDINWPDLVPFQLLYENVIILLTILAYCHRANNTTKFPRFFLMHIFFFAKSFSLHMHERASHCKWFNIIIIITVLVPGAQASGTTTTNRETKELLWNNSCVVVGVLYFIYIASRENALLKKKKWQL